MTRVLIGICLLAGSAPVFAQSSGSITIGPPIDLNPNTTSIGLVEVPLDVSQFSNVFTEQTQHVFIIGRFDELVGAASLLVNPKDIQVPAISPATFDSSRSLVAVEGWGVKLPDRQFEIPAEPAPPAVSGDGKKSAPRRHPPRGAKQKR